MGFLPERLTLIMFGPMTFGGVAGKGSPYILFFVKYFLYRLFL